MFMVFIYNRLKMIEIKQTCYKGTRILLGNKKRELLNNMINILLKEGFTEIQIPNIQFQETFNNKVGEENHHMMFNFKDRGNREICLAPEYTAVIQQLSFEYYKYQKDIKLFYIQECFRGENPQAGRYRQFTQLGVEIIHPTKEYDLPHLALNLINNSVSQKVLEERPFELNYNIKRGLDYYKDGKGFEIACEKLGAQKQVCGGGEYDGGVGFAIGIDRLLLINNIENNEKHENI